MADDAKAPAEPARDRWSIGDVEQWLPTVKVTIASIVLALVIGALLIIVSTPSVISSMSYFTSYPWDAFRNAGHAVGSSYWALLTGSVGSWTAITNTLSQAAPLICAGLGVTLAFRAGLFNIGAQGQLIIGAAFAGFVGFHTQLPGVSHLVAAILAGLLGGALWGGIAGFLKARTGAHEVIVTIMLNYTAMLLLSWLLSLKPFEQKNVANRISPLVDNNAAFPHVFGLHFGVLLAFVAAYGVWWLLNRTTLGFSMRAVGANADAARTAGMSVSMSYTMAMVIAGLLAGLAGVEQVLGDHVQLSTAFGGTVGFDAITVSLLGRATPLGTVLAGLLFGALSAGGTQMQATAGTSVSLTQILSALIVLFVAAPVLVKTIFRMKAVGDEGAVLAKGWNS
ncbi:MAG: ral nucleoside transport system permease protein [Nocardioidaceae bacterium]|jgi:simple sugar transport system permease protein|nr:ral nucleoside transport system permease protein [Nocardioidaceae bacterium]